MILIISFLRVGVRAYAVIGIPVPNLCKAGKQRFIRFISSQGETFTYCSLQLIINPSCHLGKDFDKIL